ncbi:rhomboid family intramembrane serine protease [Streptomyces sp. NPDC001595]|uniref:rhomboid family intramembrane serine protease n=1 Tax=Streptomyces sp. NPDC001532 TaxID=3154520 RepID=UPI0033188E1A
MEPESTVTTCYRHPKVECYVRCVRCDRYICPDCMREASVGHQCPECVKEGARSVRQARTVVGGKVSGTPVLTYVLVALNVLAYLVQLVRPEFQDRFAMLGARLVGPDGALYVFQEPYPAGFQAEGVAGGEWERLLTSGFLHLAPTEGTFGIAHIVMNMVALWHLGRMLETQLGRARYLALYLLATLGGSVAELLLAEPSAVFVGASGGLFGLGAAHYVMARRFGGDMRGVNRDTALLLAWLLISAGLTSWQGHLGGLLAGGAVTAAYAFVPRGPRRTLLQATACTGLLVLLLLLTYGKVSQLTGGAI